MPRTCDGEVKHGGAGSRTRSSSRPPAVEAVEPRLLFATFTVSNLNDAGPGSLRQAILDSNATAGVKDVIGFSIASGTIHLRSALPAITSPVAIDTTQEELPAATIAIDGAAAGPTASGLVINTSPIPADVTATEVIGLALYGFAGDGVRVNGNANLLDKLFIGTDATGASPLGNGGRGVFIQGGDNVLANSTVAFNGRAGIGVASGVGNDLAYNNSIFSNGGEAIDLLDDGYTANDTGDADAGPNNLQNALVLTSVTPGPGGTTVSGSVSTTPNTGLFVAFYTGTTPDPEGRRFLGSIEGVSSASGTFTFEHVLPVIPQDAYVTAAATAFGEDAPVGTSEFSNAVTAEAPPRVAGVWVSGTAWTDAGRVFLQTTGDGSAKNGWPVRGGGLQLATVPFGNVDRVTVQFTEHVVVDQGDLSLTGVEGDEYPTTGFAYDAHTYTATWTLSAAMGTDHLEIDLNADAGGVTDAENNLLDGEWADGADAFPSGDGTAGGDFRFRIRFAPGDANADGAVNGSDFALLAQNFGRVKRAPSSGDFTGDAVANGSDFAILAGNFGRTVPAAPSPTYVVTAVKRHPRLSPAAPAIVSPVRRPAAPAKPAPARAAAPRRRAALHRPKPAVPARLAARSPFSLTRLNHL